MYENYHFSIYCYVSIRYKQEKHQVFIIPTRTLNNVMSLTIS